MTRRCALVAVSLLAAAVVLASCGDSAGPEEEDAAGLWNHGCTNTAVLDERDILRINSHCAEGWELVLVR